LVHKILQIEFGGFFYGLGYSLFFLLTISQFVPGIFLIELTKLLVVWMVKLVRFQEVG
jgi:hypothetical protein